MLFNLGKKIFFSETPDLYPSVRLIVDPGSTIRPPPVNFEKYEPGCLYVGHIFG